MQTFEQVLKQWWPYVCTIVHNQTGDSGDDIASKVFEKMNNTWKGEYDSDAHVKSWLQITTTNMCIDLMRARARNKKHLQKYKYEAFNGEEPTAESDITDKDRLEIEQYVIKFLYEEIQKLPPRTKQVFELHYFKGLTYRQIAKKLGVNKNTVTNQMQTARTALRLNILFDKKAAPMLAQQLLFKPGEDNGKL